MYDLIVLGGGPAGYIAAERAGDGGLSVALIEKQFLGGVCLNEGCIPSKTLLNSAKIYDYAKFSEKYGVTTKDAILDHGAVISRKNKVVKMLTAGVKAALKKSNVDIIDGIGMIMEKSEDGYIISVGDTEYKGKKLLIATGSSPAIPPIPGIEEGLKSGFVLTNREILNLKAIPKSLVIIGGGVVGIEMASYFNSAGSKVTVIEMLDHIGGEIDRDISNILFRNYKKKGIDFKLGSKLLELKGNTLLYDQDGKTSEMTADEVLISVGRRPVTEGLGLKNIGIELERGAIKTDDRGRTNVLGVYAAGDVNGKYMLAHAAYREAEVSVNDMLGIEDRLDYSVIPSVIYTSPEVAGVGYTEAGAKSAGIDYDMVNIPMQYSGRYMAENERGDGICKVLVDKSTKKLIGVHMIGSYTSEIIYGAGIMIQNGMNIDDIKKTVFPHPTVSEIIREAIFQL
ncbi:dihydrolipoyl dehydrogenase [Xylanivirga thermophila]|jgi:dihydrolipoamide dehydrogenase|uniref:dihydrolipoyl dehydrogenase n=1 Tax=Xylanivirga thermophila TaxID=2496273 RepID=UPI00101D20DD|nr:dihydrolipoyl dehydrogenase [Xylanivirga thermophila]